VGLPPEDPSLPMLSATQVASVEYPAGLAVAPDGRIFYTELFAGGIGVIETKGDVIEWFDVNGHLGIEWTAYNHAGLSGVAIDPGFDRNRFVYAVSQVPNDRTGVPDRTVILRFTDRRGRGADPKVIFELPARRYNNTYSLVFAPDETLFVPAGSLATGGRDVPGDLVGEILHITRDGEPAPDGPFGEDAPSTYAHGIRNAFDIAIEPETGYLVTGENGDHGHDELDLIAPGRYYGWPEHEGAGGDVAGMTEPMVEIPDGHWAPTGIVRYEGRRFPELRGLFLLCMNHQPGVYAISVEPGPPAHVESFTRIAPMCTTDIATSHDGRIYVADASAVYELT
jgi:glucose/arabinose dehydrogenase